MANELTAERLAEWLADLDGVTPGPWHSYQTTIHGNKYGGHWVAVSDPAQLIQISGSGGARSFTQRVVDTQDHDDNEANAAHIARCDPDTIRALIALAQEGLAGRERKFRLNERVTKIKGSSWTGYVVGFYSTSLTPVGYAVESANELGSVQIYPEAALEAKP